MRTLARYATLTLGLALALTLGACSGGDSTGPGGDGADGGNGGSGSVPTELVGTWHTGSVSMIQYYDSGTGDWAPTSGDGYTYEFTADGKYTFAGILQISTYGCTTTLFEYAEGTATVNGSELVLQPKKGTFQSQDTCISKNNYKKDIDKKRETYTFAIGQNDYDQLALQLTWPDGGTESFVYGE